MGNSPVRLYWVPAALALVPLLVMPLCHWLNTQAGHLPGCVSYLQGCVSISAAGRYAPGNHLFDAVMTPMGAVLAGYWLLAARWMGMQGSFAVATGVLRYCGVSAGIFMVLYAVFLGIESDYGRSLRRLGINAYFFFNVVCQITMALWLRRNRSGSPVCRQVTALLLASLFMAFLSAAENLLPDNNRIDNIIEWNFALFMSLHFLAMAAEWRRCGFSLQAQQRMMG
ncbi:MAG: hypothetical protein QNJ40_02085 [Xanthomonadales bacterium]|nr:hypothetical protein [Xanthomonadales bacterium]